MAIWDADRLSKKFPLYVATGSRPDFIVQTSKGWHGIEARGRGSRGPVGSQRPAAVQKKKLEGMHSWSSKVAKHSGITAPPSWSMSWAWITTDGTWVDHFDPGEPVQLKAEDEQAVWSQMSETAATLANVDDPRVRRVDAMDRQVSVVSRPIQENYGNDGPAWLTVASWSERMTDEELRERRPRNGIQDTEAVRELLGNIDRATMGAFMATAITDRPPRTNELNALLRAIANQSTNLHDDDPGRTGGRV